MKLTLFSGRANRALAEKVASSLDRDLGRCLIKDFPDDEVTVTLQQDVQGHDLFLIQPLAPPVAANLLELLLLADAAYRAGARRLTAVIPYMGYARQDRRAVGGEPVAARLMADLLGSRFQRVIAVDLHNPAIEGFFPVPLEHISAVPLLAAGIKSTPIDKGVLVAPDLGAVKLVRRYADHLGMPAATVHKVRSSGDEVHVLQIIGEVEGRHPVVVDDMISTGGTVIAAIEALLERGCQHQITIVASHGLLVGGAAEQLARLPIERILLTDSVGFPRPSSLPIQTVSLSASLARQIASLHGQGS